MTWQLGMCRTAVWFCVSCIFKMEKAKIYFFWRPPHSGERETDFRIISLFICNHCMVICLEKGRKSKKSVSLAFLFDTFVKACLQMCFNRQRRRFLEYIFSHRVLPLRIKSVMRRHQSWMTRSTVMAVRTFSPSAGKKVECLFVCTGCMPCHSTYLQSLPLKRRVRMIFSPFPFYCLLNFLLFFVVCVSVVCIIEIVINTWSSPSTQLENFYLNDSKIYFLDLRRKKCAIFKLRHRRGQKKWKNVFSTEIQWLSVKNPQSAQLPVWRKYSMF